MARVKKEASATKYTIQQYGCIYLLINAVFLLPTVLIRPVLRPLLDMIYSHLPRFAINILDCVGMVFLVWWIPLIFYYLFRLMYLHFALSIGFLVFSVYKLIKEKNIKLFLSVLLLTTVSTVFNIYWLMEAGPYTVV